MHAKLVFPRPSGQHLLVQRYGSKLTAQLVSGDVVLARATGDASASYVFPDSDQHHALNVGYSASFDVTPREADCIRDQLGIGCRPLGDGTSFEASPGDILRETARLAAEVVTGVKLAQKVAA